MRTPVCKKAKDSCEMLWLIVLFVSFSIGVREQFFCSYFKRRFLTLKCSVRSATEVALAFRNENKFVNVSKKNSVIGSQPVKVL